MLFRSFDNQKPWEAINKDENRANHILYLCLEVNRNLLILLNPFLPDKSKKAWKQINLKGSPEDKGNWETLGELKIGDNHEIGKPKPLFRKLEDKDLEKVKKIVSNTKELGDFFDEEQKLNKTQKPKIDMVEESANVVKVGFSEWQKLDLRVAEIKSVEDVEGADKLYKMSLDVGELGERTVAAGLKPHYSKEKLEGKKIVYFSNLEPKKLKGIESQGMILAAVSESDGKENKVVLLTPEEDIEIGSKIS